MSTVTPGCPAATVSSPPSAESVSTCTAQVQSKSWLVIGTVDR